jgi:hypothetical protein
MVRQVPDVGKEPISTRVESYFLKNHPDSYLTHQMAYNATKLHATVKKRDAAQNWLVYFQVKHSRTPSTRPTTKAFVDFLVSKWMPLNTTQHKLKN